MALFFVTTMFIAYYFEKKENIYLDDYRTISKLFDGNNGSKTFNSLEDIRSDLIDTLTTISEIDSRVFYDIDISSSTISFETL